MHRFCRPNNCTMFVTLYRSCQTSKAYWLDDTRVADMDARMCMTRRISEESDRQREQGWFLLRALQTAQMSFDLSHIPSSMVRRDSSPSEDSAKNLMPV